LELGKRHAGGKFLLAARAGKKGRGRPPSPSSRFSNPPSSSNSVLRKLRRQERSAKRNVKELAKPGRPLKTRHGGDTVSWFGARIVLQDFTGGAAGSWNLAGEMRSGRRQARQGNPKIIEPAGWPVGNPGWWTHSWWQVDFAGGRGFAWRPES